MTLLAALLLTAYPSPVELAATAERLYVVCEGTGELAVVDLRTRAVSGRVRVGRVPKGIVLEGARAWVANSWDDTVSEVDLASMKVARTLPAGYEPTSVAVHNGFLYAANRISGDVSVVELAGGKEVRRLLAGRGASYLALAPDKRSLYCTHVFPNPGPHRSPPRSEITVIDTRRQIVTDRIRVENAAGMFHSAVTPDGRLGMVAQLRPRNLIPLAHVGHGWAFGNSLTVFGAAAGEPVQILIDEIDRYYALPFSVVMDGSAAYVSASSANSVTVIDLARLKTMLARRRDLANDLSASARYVTARIPVGRNPKGMALSPDGARLYVCNRLDDTISVIDTRAQRSVATIPVGGPETLTAQRRGERLFHDARFSFQGQFGCASCHIDGSFDGLSWDLEPDGFGIDIVDNRLIEGVADTAPFKWNGGNPDLETECGPRTEKFFYRRQSFSQEQLADLVAYLKSIPLRPNRYRQADLTAAQERGKAIYERTRTKAGQPIPEMNQCPVCHSGSSYTNRQLADVGSGKATDRSPLVDVPQLVNVAYTAPYLHDGSAATLEEIWTVFNPRDTHGVSNDLTKDELNDLIEYLKTL